MNFWRNFLIYFSVVFSSFSYSEVIKDIDIIGLNNLSRGTILNYLPYELGDDFLPASVQISREKLLKTGLFKNIHVDFSGGILKLSIQENPVIKFFDFKNYDNGLVLNDDLIQKIKDNSNLKIGKIYNEKSLVNLIKELQALYQNQAFYNAKITFKTFLDSMNRIGIELIFDENEPSLIQDIAISGNSVFEDDELLDLFEMGPPDFFPLNYFTEKDRFDRNKLDAAIESIKNKYINFGYVDIEIKNIDFKLLDDKSKILINVELSEGEQYKIKNVKFQGDISDFSESFLYEKFNFKDGEIFNRKEILRGINNLRSIYSDRGYAFAEISTKVSKTAEPYKYDLNIIVNKNKLVYVNRIEISGNNRTQDDVIRREIKIKEGQFYSQQEIDDSIKSIKRLGYFSSVKFDTSTNNSDPDQIDIFIKVEETKTGEFSVGLSHSNATGPAFSAGITQSNILGTGNVFNGKFTNSAAVSELSFYFSNPYFKKNGESISYGVFTKKTDASGIDVGSYVIDEIGASLGYGIPLDEYSNLLADLKLSTNDLTCGSIFSNYEPTQCSDKDNFDTSVSLKYSHNSLNDFYSPTNGFKSLLKGTVSIPVGDLQYYQIDSLNSYYQPINDKLTFSLKGNVQFAEGYGNKSLPFYKRLFAGGSSSVRGFDFNSLGSKYLDNSPKGGELTFLTSGSIIVPGKMAGIENENIRLSAFVDAGSISDKLSEFQLSDIRASTGLALSWLTPVGPIGLHLSKPILKKSGDSLETFSFQLGTSF